MAARSMLSGSSSPPATGVLTGDDDDDDDDVLLAAGAGLAAAAEEGAVVVEGLESCGATMTEESLRRTDVLPVADSRCPTGDTKPSEPRVGSFFAARRPAT